MLTWDWKSKFGEIEYENYKTNLYKGNAMLIEIWESEDEKQYQIQNFLCDKMHFKNCLKDRKGDWLFKEIRKVTIYSNIDEELWIWIKELVKRGIEVYFISRPF